MHVLVSLLTTAFCTVGGTVIWGQLRKLTRKLRNRGSKWHAS